MSPAPTQLKANHGLPAAAGCGQSAALLVEPASTTPLGPRILSADEAACRLTGYSQQSLLGSPIGLVYDNRDLPKLLARLPRIAETCEPFWMDRTLIKARGHRQRARWTIRAHRTGDGRLIGYFLTVDAIVSAAGGGLAFEANPAGSVSSEKGGGKQAPGEGRSPARAMTNRLSKRISTAGAGASGEGGSGKKGVPDAVGAASPTAPAERAARGEGGGKPSAVPDVNSLAMAAGAVAHDIKNNLHSIKANLDLAHRVAPLESALASRLSDAKMALGYAEALARRMLAFARGETRELCAFDVEPLLSGVVAICTAGTQVRCQSRVSPERLPVYGDRQEISQVFHNLVTNACDAMPKGGLIEIAVASRRWDSMPPGLDLPAGAYTVVSVRDRGCGIPEEHLPLIFESRFTTKAAGSGFGLAASLAAVKRHGGTITVDSKPGRGTEFLVFLPVAEKEADQRGVRKSPAAPSAGQGAERGAERQAAPVGGPTEGGEADACCRILLVEDQHFVAKATSGMLEHLGHRVSVAENGNEALRLHQQAKFSDDPFDLVLLDMTLPGGLDGGQVFERMRRFDPGVRVVATSGYFDEDDTSVLGTHEYTGILAKPFSIEALELVIRAAFDALA